MEDYSTDKEEMDGVSWVEIEQADNGFIVEWSAKIKRPGASELDHCERKRHKKLFPMEKEAEAWEKFKALKKAEWANKESY